jgi:hypothetical protein
VIEVHDIEVIDLLRLAVDEEFEIAARQILDRRSAGGDIDRNLDDFDGRLL